MKEIIFPPITDIIVNTIIKSTELEKRFSRIEYIKRIFQHEIFLGILEKQVKRNPYYYNDTFDKLYDLDFYQLEELEQNIHQVVARYKQGNYNGE